MVEYLPETGESPQSVDKRISAEAFFPVRAQKLFFKNIAGGEGTFFRESLYADLSYGTTVGLERHYGILDIERRNVICCVTYDNYELVKNADAVDIAKKYVIPEIFKGDGAQTYLCNGLVISNSRGQSYIDMCSYDYRPPVKFGDIWLPFMRITNSYNRSLKLTYRIGFCHRYDGNRIIFSDRTIDLDTIHKGVERKIKAQVNARFGDMEDLEKSFYEGLISLNKYFLPKKRVLEMICKVFGYTRKWVTGKRNLDVIMRNHAIVGDVIKLTREFFDAHGDSAYSVFCVLTAFATRPPFDLKRMMVNQIHQNQSIVGNWVVEFVGKMSRPDFCIEDYFDVESVFAADVLVRDYQSIEQSKPSSERIDPLFVTKDFIIK